MKNATWFFFSFLFVTTMSHATMSHANKLTPESVMGTYHLGIPERGQQQVDITYGDMKGKTVIAVAPCVRCPPAIYSYLKKESNILNIPVFTTNGLYLIQYNNDSFVVVQPDSILGEKAWSIISHLNIYSKNETTASTLSRTKIEQFAIKISHKVLGEDLGEMQHKTGIYNLARPIVHIGNAESQYNIEWINGDNKEINITPCSKCSIHQYQHLTKESAITGVGVYHDRSGYYLFDIEPGILVHAFSNASGLGNSEWGEKSHFNVFSNNPAYIRFLLTSVDKQALIHKQLKGYFSAVKAAFDKSDTHIQQEKTETAE